MLYPISTKTRTVQDLNGIWKFKLEDDRAPNDVSTPLETDRHMFVPGSFNDQGVTRDIRMHVGYVWYEREFVIPDFLLNQRVVLRLDAATHEADVYVNGKFVVRHKGGYIPFEAEIQDVIHPGKNRVSVKLSNRIDYTSLPVGNYSETKMEDGRIVRKLSENFDFFNYAGLNRYVRIYTTPKSYLEDIAISYDVDLAALSADVKVATCAKGDFDNVKVTILDANDSVVGKGEGENAIVSLKDIKLWQPLNAYLYKARVELYKADELIDVYEEEFGIRTVEVKNSQFLINGKPFYFKGYGKHEDTYINGRGINEAYNVADINLMRWMGANSFRTSHYPYSEEMMRCAIGRHRRY